MTTTRLLQRQILPKDRDLDVLSLYVDADSAVLDADKYDVGGNRGAKALNAAALRQATSTGAAISVEQIEDRHRLRIPVGERLSFGTYFNAFPASYWRRWTVVTDVRLTVTVSGRGATVTVYRSMANGRSQRVESRATDEHGRDDDSATFEFDLSLKPFTDGGWYWYDVIAGDTDLVVHSAEWTAEVPDDKAEQGTTTVGITTMNRPDFCAKLLRQIGEDEDLRPYLDQVLVVDQGSANQKVTGSEFFAEASGLLGDQLEVIEQANLGGSGGYARGQMEAVRRNTATYFMCMDDDVVCEPEGIIRAVTFGDLARRPTIVGGHMFSLYSRSRLYSLGEIVMPWRFWWRSAPGVFQDWDFAARNLRSTRWLHMRVDSDYNGWFMCLIPTQVLAEIGLSLPLFIKWDDSEFGLRARAAGYPSVSFPGAAVWHIPWTDKNDALDWQSYFHQRNRFVAALLHSQFPHGGKMVQESFSVQVKHLISMQYSTAELRLKALEDVFAGPDQLHDDLAGKLGEIRAFVQQFPDAQLQSDPDAFPQPRRAKPRKKNDSVVVPSLPSRLVSATLGTLRQFRKERAMAHEFPEGALPAIDARWYRLATYDSAVVSMPDGNSAAFYQRDRDQFTDLLRRSVDLHQRLYREWPRLAALYRDQLGEITSPQRWEKTITASTPTEKP
jgi:galactofuranosylgalactofuranosylrhamnosyl-N-acetylglucosaminyl-diphospho-decaprenol beta-1,5/1,6-galactofuranosyltransferase